jgi:hypothetical protein
MMVHIEALQALDSNVWTYLLSQEPEQANLVVTDVVGEPCGRSGQTVRYLVSLAGHSDYATFIGKQTNAVEACFYRHYAHLLPSLTPRCWFSHISGDQGWLLIDEAHNNRPLARWSVANVETVIAAMATLHATFWDQTSTLVKSGGLPYFIGPPKATFNGLTRYVPVSQEQPPLYLFEEQPYASISDHALKHAGRLSPRLIRAAEGVEQLQAIGGLPGIIDDQHIVAAADLIDDPLPMIQPLLELPFTLIHGAMSPHQWRLSLFHEQRLLDWRQTAVGPSVYDLISFIEQFDLLPGEHGRYQLRHQWPASEETMIDSYMLRMSSLLGSRFNARAVRQAIPAARCLYLISNWLPRFAHWPLAKSAPALRHDTLYPASRSRLAEAGWQEMAGLEPYLAGLFKRFLVACRAL